MNKIFKLLLVLMMLLATLLVGCSGGGDETVTGSMVVGKVEPLDNTKNIIDPVTGQQLVNDQILITFKDSVSESAATAKIAAINGEIVGFINGINDYQVRIKENPSLDQLKTLVIQLNSDPDVATASLNRILQMNKIPDGDKDPEWFAGIDWDWTGWSEADPRGRNWGLEAIYAPSAWDYNNSMGAVKVGIVDGGFKIDHEDLNIPQQNASGSNSRYYSISSDAPEYKNNNDHGSHIAGIIGAISNNSNGITGLLWKRDIYVYRTDYQTFDIKFGIVWNLKKGAKVINLSIGNYTKKNLGHDPSDTGPEANLLEDEKKVWTEFMLKLLKEYDFLVVQAAGNEGIDAKWAGLFNSIDNVELRKRIITVGAVDFNQISSNTFNIPSFSNTGSKVDVVAPGVDIFSTRYHSDYGEMSGTSQAAPHVTGIAGMLWAIDSGMSAERVKEVIVSTANMQVGNYKMVNAKEAVESSSGGGADTSPEPNISISGYVQNIYNKDRIAGAIVSTSLDSVTATTDYYGFFSLYTDTRPPNSLDIPYTINISASGYEQFSINKIWGNQQGNVIFEMSHTINPLVAQTPYDGYRGTNFIRWGTGFTPYGIANIHFLLPDGNESTIGPINLDSTGHFEYESIVSSTAQLGTHYWWAIDEITNKKSNTVTFIIKPSTSGGWGEVAP